MPDCTLEMEGKLRRDFQFQEQSWRFSKSKVTESVNFKSKVADYPRAKLLNLRLKDTSAAVVKGAIILDSPVPFVPTIEHTYDLLPLSWKNQFLA